jgi:thiamine kinase-like enzyme
LAESTEAADDVRVMILRDFPQWSSRPLSIRPLAGGITNRNFTIAVDGREYVARVPGERTELLGIDRANEAEASYRAASLGIGPPVVGELTSVGTLVTELVPGHHLGADDFVARLADVVPLIRRFHDTDPLEGAFPIHRVVEWHARDAARFGARLPGVVDPLMAISRRIEAAFTSSPESPVPCHNDLLPGNVLFDADRVWLLDFEYAGMNDRYFDLGNLSVNCGLDAEAEEELLRAYFGAVTSRSRARLALMKIMSEFREGMWAVVQQAISTLDTDFVSYANERLGNCQRLAAAETLGDLLNAAASR